MIHLRVVSPPDVTGTLMPVLHTEPAVMNLTVLPGAVSNPDGDAVHFDVLHGAANEVIGRLRDLGLEQRGSTVLENVDTSISALADRVTARRGRFQQFTPVWAEIEARIGLEGTFPPNWFALLIIAGLIGAVGILTNSQILIVGAMVVGPECGAIVSLAFGVTRRDSSRVLRSAAALVIGFTLAVAGALLLSLIVRWAGLEPTAYALGIRPVSNLINTPNWFSFIVAALAGVVGVVSLTEARSSTLIGVFISVTTIPAASDIGVSLAFGSGSEAWGSALQLLLDVTVLAAVAIAGTPGATGHLAADRPAGHRGATRLATQPHAGSHSRRLIHPCGCHPHRTMTAGPQNSEADLMTGTLGMGTGPAIPPPGRMTEAEFRSLYERLRGQVPWGPDDRRGALNYITPAEVLAASGEVRLGRSVSLAAPVEDWVAADNPDPAQHQMQGPLGADAGPGLSFSMDRIAMNIHGNADSHVDALCHVIFDGELYNAVPAGTVTATGAAELSIAVAADGIVGRGVLLDVPRSRGVPWLEPGDHVTVDDLLATEREQGVRVGQGDIVLVRVGHRQRRNERGPWDAAQARAGLHPTVLPLLAQRRIATLGSDGNNDTAPSAAAGVDFPVHVLAVNALGLHLLDYLEFTELTEACAEAGRWSFLCIIAPLRLPTGTGSPVNPIAVL